MGGENSNAGAAAILAVYMPGSCGFINVFLFIGTLLIQIGANILYLYPFVVFILFLTGMDGLWFHVVINILILSVFFLIFSAMFGISLLFRFIHPMCIRYKEKCPFTLLPAESQCPMCGVCVNDTAMIVSRIGTVASSSTHSYGTVSYTTTMASAFSEGYVGCPCCIVVKSFFHSIFGIFSLISCFFKKLPNCGSVAFICSALTFWFPLIGLIIVFIIVFSTDIQAIKDINTWLGLLVGCICMIEVFFLARVCENIQPLFYMITGLVCFPILSILSVKNGEALPKFAGSFSSQPIDEEKEEKKRIIQPVVDDLNIEKADFSGNTSNNNNNQGGSNTGQNQASVFQYQTEGQAEAPSFSEPLNYQQPTAPMNYQQPTVPMQQQTMMNEDPYRKLI